MKNPGKKHVERELAEAEMDRGIMAMIVESFNECCIEVTDVSIEARRTAARHRTNLAGMRSAGTMKQEASGANWSSWFAHYHGAHGGRSEAGE